MTRTYISLFAGVGGLDLAAEAMGYECRAQVEWDKGCSAVLARHWPAVPRWGDIRTFGAAAYAQGGGVRRGEPSGRDGLAGCGRADATDAERHGLQGRIHEVAGQGAPPIGRRPPDAHSVDLIVAGFPCQPASTAGKRRGRADDRWLWPQVARVVGDLRPRAVLLENVPGITTVDGGRAFSDVLADLAAVGYDARWDLVRASAVGACHRRERIFILATPERADADGIGRGLGGQGLRAEGDQGEPQARPSGLGASTDATGIGPHGHRPPRPGGPGPQDGHLGTATAWGRYADAIARAERAAGRPAPAPVDANGRLSPEFVRWMMMFPAGWVDGMTRTQALKALGNAVVWPQAVAGFRQLSAPVDLRGTA